MILVTGANGLLGSRLVYDLVKTGNHVRALIRPGANLSVVKSYFRDDEASFNKIDWQKGDVLDIFSIDDALRNITQVYHCAAKVSFNPSDREEMMEVNIRGTANMVNASLQSGIKKFCHTSSVAAIGRSLNGETIMENTLWKTSRLNSNYAISKYGAEREVWRGIAEGLDAVIVNPVIILGRGNWNEGSPSMIKKVYEGLKFFTLGSNGFVDVADVSECMMRLMESPLKNERFIIQSENLSYLDFFTLVARYLNKPAPAYRAGPLLSNIAWRLEKLKSFVTGKRPLITKETARTAGNSYFYSSDKIRRSLGFTFIPVKKSLEMLCSEFLKEQI
jgi:dihydroflavonol-4-reductase